MKESEKTFQSSTHSLDRWKQKFIGSTAAKPIKKYTGHNMIGIAQMSKSNAIPVFSAEEAKGTVKVK